MSDTWNAAAARKKLRAMPETLVCDALLDQNVFAGVGNIIKNEVLYPDPRAPVLQGRRIATGQAAQDGGGGAHLQLSVPGMEACRSC